MKNTALAACLLALLTSNCSTELDVNAPYKEITIVYATLSTKKLDGNTPETTHYVKINRAFQGEGDALVYAAIPDSNEYSDEQLDSARVERWLNGTLVHSYSLNDTVIPDRLPGTFHYPDQKVYYFNTTAQEPLDDLSEYRFFALVKGVPVTATTAIVNNNSIAANVQSGVFKPVLYNNNGYQDYEVEWESGEDGRRYESYYTFYYREFTSPTDSVSKSFTRLIGSTATTGLNGGQDLIAIMSGLDFYTTVASQVPPATGGMYRKFLGIEFHWAVASDEFHTYLQLSQPITGIVEDRPDFTNVTNGYGIFVSRFFKRAPGNEPPHISDVWDVDGRDYRTLSENSIEHLVSGPLTIDRNFCSPYSTDPDLSCP